MGAKSSRNTTQNNRSDGHLLEYFRNTFVRGGGAATPSPGFGPPQGHTATGGVISDYTDPGTSNVYRAHIFTSTGTFNVTSLSGTYPATVEYLVVAGGGGGAARHGGGGGAGGLLVSPGFPGIPTSQNQGTTITVPASVPAPYSVTIGAGGVGGLGPDNNTSPPAIGTQGGTSSFGPVSATGGGYGASVIPYPPGGTPGGPGGSGGGGSNSGTSIFGTGGPATSYPGPTQQGFPGGAGGPGVPSHGAGAGGGAGEAGQNAVSPATGGRGGAGLTVYIASPPTQPAPENSFAGGGGGGGDTAGAGSPIGGGGAGGSNNATAGTYATGGGGGGSRTLGPGDGGNGGSGIVVVRYQIGKLTAEQKATGGAISYYVAPAASSLGAGQKTIHTFTSTGTFTNTSGSPLSIEYVVVAGGGGGGRYGGGGGAGGYLTSTATCPTSPVTVTIGAGGLGRVGGAQSGERGTDGIQTTLTGALTVTATGGGAGGTYGNPPGTGSPGNPGGSGGGGGTNNIGTSPTYAGGTGAAGPPRQGYDGGTGVTWGPSSGGAGGGGGAGGPGTPGPTGSTGGVGLQVPVTFRNPLTYYDPANQWYLAGGGAGIKNPSTVSGGAGGGGSSPSTLGAQVPSPFGADGLTSTGGGGAGTGQTYTVSDPTEGRAGNGGSGIVIIAYPS